MQLTRKAAPFLGLATLGLLGWATAPSAQAQDFTATTVLQGSNEVPGNATLGTGTATVTYDSALSRLGYTVVFSGLTAYATAAHIHFGASGTNGPVILPFTNQGPPTATSGTFSGFLTSTDLINSGTTGISSIGDAAKAISAGTTYVNIHTTTYPGGELRGQLTVPSASVAPEPSSVADCGVVALVAAGLVLKARKRKSTLTSGV